MNDLISIIVPIYNTSIYLKKCVTSLINQSYSNIEIICVDNNSTDNSLSILKEMQLQDNRVKVFNQPIKGASATRNKGLDEARGEYIVFVDSDDWVGVDYIKNLYESLKEHKVDMIASTVNRVVPSRSDVWEDEYFGLALFNNYEKKLNLEDILKKFKDFCFTVYARIYRADIIKNCNIKFNENLIVGEDILFNLNYMVACKNFSFYIIKQYDYYYLTHPNSILFTNAYNSSIFLQHKALKDWFVKHNYFNIYKRQYFEHKILEISSRVYNSPFSFYKLIQSGIEDIELDSLIADPRVVYKRLKKISQKPLKYFILNNLFYTNEVGKYFKNIIRFVLYPFKAIYLIILGLFFIIRNINR